MSQVPKTSLHDFVNGETVTETMLDQNFEVLRVSINDTDNKVNQTYNQSQVNTKISDLAGSGRTTETIKDTFDETVRHKTSGDHDTRYYQKGETYSQNQIDTALAGKQDKNTVGSKPLDETSIGNDKFLKYNASTGKIEYSLPPGATGTEMSKSTYDTNNNGKVDYAENSDNAYNADKLGNQSPSYYAKSSDIGDVTTLPTAAKTVVPAIAELKAGQFNLGTSTYDIKYNAASDSLDFIDKNTNNVIKRLYRNGDLKIIGELYEGVIMKYGFDYTKTDTTQADWATGTLTNVSATLSSGDLTLATGLTLGDYDANHVAVYRFEETSGATCTDTKGSYNGTYTGTTSITDGVSGNARRFAGGTDKVTFSNQVIPIGAKSIRFRIRKNGNPSAPQAIFDNCDAGTGNNGTACWITTSGVINFKSSKATAGTYRFDVTGSKVVTDNQWHDVLLTWDGTTTTGAVKLYVDGVLDITGTALSTETVNATYNLFICSLAVTVSTYPFVGDLDEFEVSNVVRQPISYKSSGTRLSTYPLDSVKVAKSATIGWTALLPTYLTSKFKFDESSGTIANDSVGSFNGTYNGTTSVTGYSGLARSFATSADFVQFSSAVIPLGTKAIRFRFKGSTLPSSNSWLVILDNADFSSTMNGDTVAIDSSGKVYWYSGKGAGGGTQRFYFGSTMSICDGQWHDILFTWDGTTATNGVKLYVDGTLNNQTTANATETTTASYNLRIGKTASQGNYPLVGTLDELEFFNKVITPNSSPVWSILIETSLDGTNFQTVTNGGNIPQITDGTDVKGKMLYVRQTLSTTDTTVTPKLNDLTINVLSKEG